MSTTITIDGAGRIVIPKAVRDRYSLSAGSVLSVEDDDGRIVLTPAHPGPRMVDRGGRLVLDLGLADVVTAVREAREARLSDLIGYALKR